MMDNSFWDGFQKEAVSDEWALRHAKSGIESRLKRGDITRKQADRMSRTVDILPKFTLNERLNHEEKLKGGWPEIGPFDPKKRSKLTREMRLQALEDANRRGPKKTSPVSRAVSKKRPLPASKGAQTFFEKNKGKIGIGAGLLAAGGAAAAYMNRDKKKS
jgi:hypothetical protein